MIRSRPWFRLAVLLLLVAAPDLAAQELRLPSVLGSHMVLQRDRAVPLWGWAPPESTVSVVMGERRVETTAGAEGRWRLELPPHPADGRAHRLVVEAAGQRIECEDVLFGEVWLCSGQSNMEWAMTRVLDHEREIAAAEHPQLRLFNVPGHLRSEQPKDDTPGAWQACTPRSVAGFSAVAYFFGEHLHRELGVPIGLIGTNWGGTRIEPWTPPEGFAAVPELERYRSALEEMDASSERGKAAAHRHLDAVEQWLAESRGRADRGQPLTNPPARPDLGSIDGATAIYNAMVHGLAPFAARGVIWYQGESNAGDGDGYLPKMKALIRGWREVFENPELGFYWVQLANFRAPGDDPAGGGWGPVREAQRRALSEPGTGMAVIIDIGEANDIHPRNKQDVGRRLARGPLHDLYGQEDRVPSGPLYRSMAVEGNRIRLSFDHVGGGLMLGRKQGLDPVVETADASLARFAIRDAAGKWHWARARIEGDQVVVQADGVEQPDAVRYAYENNPEGANLYNREGLPASPFRTDD